MNRMSALAQFCGMCGYLRSEPFVQHPANSGDPVGDDRIEVAIDYVGGGAA